ncbi:heterokaryon incompatibility protein-domain-containing protein [Alternaria rosae]|uniref:heterokaryon incompatibility protein-domain-containing protein n=1 Tax=Alternaria rosae TaxID=1187941 RepID=UPI001E8D372B|nr:heterokaryon incompatibility protein-domain-containing protein [Alternaria rosae]KAH6875222.1 heterokaryon incompatibility protein-domain-containing protein [Alternaria rosae]
MSAIVAATCSRCTGILLDEGIFYALESLDNMTRSQCPGCDFFLKVARRHGVNVISEAQTQILLVRRSKDGNLIKVYYFRNNNSQLSIAETCELRLCAAFGFEIPFCADFEGLDDRYLGRRIASQADSAERFDVAKSWLERCTRSHGAACALEAAVGFPTRLVHISRDDPSQLKLCLTQNMKGRYVALSYSWGTGNTYKTTAKSIDRLRSGFRTADLPKTLQHAVAIAHKMDFEWIWIDQLCILQDSVDDWSFESSHMAKVYGNSAFTICADSSSNTEDGIFHDRTVLQSHSFGPNFAMCLQTICTPWRDMVNHPLYHRGWAFQERILSARNLHFLQSQIAWECNTTLYLEEGRGRHSNPDTHFPKHMFTKFYHQQEDVDPDPTEFEIIKRIGAWNSILQEMAVRQLTKETDKFPSISGLATAVKTPEMGDYMAGVWAHNPFISMAWFPRFPQKQPEVYRSPSWSCRWTDHQIVWYYDTWLGSDDKSTDVISDWVLWNDRYGPRLEQHNIILMNEDKKGRVKEGSSLTMTGHCRSIYVANLPHSDFDHNFNEVDWAIGKINSSAHRVCMDERLGSCDDVCSFTADFPGVDQQYDRENVREYLCVQIVRERKEKWKNPKVIGLVLERSKGSAEEAFRRVGLTDFDMTDGAWVRKTLKLL